MKVQGTFDVSLGCPEAYRALTNPQKIVGTLPDIESYELRDDGFTVDARVGVGSMRGIMKVQMDIVEREANVRAVYQGRGQGMGSIVGISAGFMLREMGTGASVDWTGNATIAGRLASVGGGTLEPLVRKHLEHFVDAIRGSLGGT